MTFSNVLDADKFCQNFWIQKAIKEKKFVANQVPGKLNISDSCMNHVNCNTMMKLLDMMGFKPEQHGRKIVMNIETGCVVNAGS